MTLSRPSEANHRPAYLDNLFKTTPTSPESNLHSTQSVQSVPSLHTHSANSSVSNTSSEGPTPHYPQEEPQFALVSAFDDSDDDDASSPQDTPTTKNKPACQQRRQHFFPDHPTETYPHSRYPGSSTTLDQCLPPSLVSKTPTGRDYLQNRFPKYHPNPSAAGPAINPINPRLIISPLTSPPQQAAPTNHEPGNGHDQ
ncbi:hypothetical protein MBLNU230_g3258t1 [Neophaeotheca triangularis]